MVLITCSRCGATVEAKRSTKRFCATCLKLSNREQQAAYGRSEKGRLTSRKATARWLQSEAGQAYMHEWDKFGAKAATRQRAYRKTGKGRAAITRQNCVRAGIPFANAIRIAELVGDGKAVCYWCGAPATDVDHVLPTGLAKLFGLEATVDDYVGAMCALCHRAKSKMDRGDVSRLRRTVPEA